MDFISKNQKNGSVFSDMLMYMTLIAIMLAGIIVGAIVFTKTHSETIPVESPVPITNSIVLVEKQVINGYYLCILKDNITDRRILTYNGAAVLLPVE